MRRDRRRSRAAARRLRLPESENASPGETEGGAVQTRTPPSTISMVNRGVVKLAGDPDQGHGGSPRAGPCIFWCSRDPTGISFRVSRQIIISMIPRPPPDSTFRARYSLDMWYRTEAPSSRHLEVTRLVLETGHLEMTRPVECALSRLQVMCLPVVGASTTVYGRALRTWLLTVQGLCPGFTTAKAATARGTRKLTAEPPRPA